MLILSACGITLFTTLLGLLILDNNLDLLAARAKAYCIEILPRAIRNHQFHDHPHIAPPYQHAISIYYQPLIELNLE